MPPFQLAVLPHVCHAPHGRTGTQNTARTHDRRTGTHARTVGAAVDELRRVGDAVLREPHAQIQEIAHQPNRLVECSCNARDSTDNLQRTPYAQRSR